MPTLRTYTRSAPTFTDRLLSGLDECFVAPMDGETAVWRLDDIVGFNAPRNQQQELKRTLRDIRRAHEVDAPAPPASLLARRGSLQCRGAPLGEAVAQLSRKNGLPILLVQPHGKSRSGLPERRVTCDLDDVPLREALRAIAPAENAHGADDVSDASAPAVIDEGDVIVLASVAEAERRISTRVYPLGRLLDLFPELDARQVLDLIAIAVTPTEWSKLEIGDFGSHYRASRDAVIAAALPSALIVRHHAAGHAASERLLAYAQTQAKAFPRPYDLTRDDHREAQARLAARLRAAEDPLEVCWLAWMICVVDRPSEELAEALFAQLEAARQEGDFQRAASLLRPIAYCGRAVDIDELQSLLADVPALQPQEKWRAAVLTALAALGPEGAAVLAKQLDGSDNTVSRNERTHVLSLLARYPSDAQAAIPAVVELLSPGPSFAVSVTLKTLDPQGTASRAYIKRRLEPELTEEERDHLESLSSKIDKLFGTK